MIFLPFFLLAPSLSAALRIVSWNIRLDFLKDDISVRQSLDSLADPLEQFNFLSNWGGFEVPWSTRRLRLAELLDSEGIVLAGFQEALKRQVDDIQELFGDGWAYVGVGRDDGVAAGEFSPVFYKKDTFDLLSNESFWASQTPFEPSRYPGASSYRVCTIADLHVKGDNRNITVLNTHLDNLSENQRRLGGSLLLIRAKYAAVTTGNPVVVLGDFNSPPTGANSGAYNIITGVRDPVAVNATFAEKYAVGDDEGSGFKMLDLRGEAPRRSVSNTFATFTGFSASWDRLQWSRIDFIFGGSNRGWTADGYKVVNVMGDDGTLTSDHRPVFVDLSLSV